MCTVFLLKQVYSLWYRWLHFVMVTFFSTTNEMVNDVCTRRELSEGSRGRLSNQFWVMSWWTENDTPGFVLRAAGAKIFGILCWIIIRKVSQDSSSTIQNISHHAYTPSTIHIPLLIAHIPQRPPIYPCWSRIYPIAHTPPFFRESPIYPLPGYMGICI